ncbi:hypothetical protein VSF3289_04385 [Vibrio scophthalmi]|uniref:Uncharacterized protein n=1 Tax=Vibrio scophthalmi TaxID=45658 RepID=A0A1E3WHF6_9VIBR|nr:hypothetical protein VSF3289_04385 [Vibrio scophthalmi]
MHCITTIPCKTSGFVHRTFDYVVDAVEISKAVEREILLSNSGLLSLDLLR